jgi:hypothetical protein
MKYKLLFILTFFFAQCELEELNVDPSRPSDATVSQLLPPALEAAASESAQDAAVIAGIFAQYFEGIDNWAEGVENYRLDESFLMNPIWQDFYNTPMNTLSIIIRKAEEENRPHYAGVARIVLAYCLGTVTSLWGDAPFSEAFRGSEIPEPDYDSQEFLYERIQQLLDTAIEDLQKPAGSGGPAADDVFFQGDTGKWLKTAHALKVRYYMHLVKRLDNAAELALPHIPQAFSGPEDDFSYQYGFTDAERNPYYDFFRNTPYVEVDEDFVDRVSEPGDPREEALFRRSFGRYLVGPYYGSEDSPVPLMTYAELKFLEAEALLRTQNPAAEAALQEAITTHVNQLTDNALTADSLAAFAQKVGTLPGDFTSDLETIINQKYIAHFSQIEGWTDFRRTGFPQLTPNEGADNPQNPGGAIPRRFVYPLNETLYNDNVPRPLPNLQSRFWWDK